MSPRWLEADWPAPSGVRAISTWRVGGVSTAPYASLNLGDHVGDQHPAVQENRDRLTQALNLPSEPRWLTQVHGINVMNLDAPLPGPADAAFTTQAGRVCAILTADCLPVMFTTAAGDRVGAAHAGWRGLAQGVLEALVQAMDAPASQLLVWLGPAIGPKHFEVGEDVREEFVKQDHGAASAFTPNERQRFMADLPELARRRLRAAGVSRLFGGGECTHANLEHYFSHRRDGTTGRQATLIWRKAG
jgi:polyphenol oxidase